MAPPPVDRPSSATVTDSVPGAPFPEPSPSTPGGTTRIGRSDSRASPSPTLPSEEPAQGRPSVGPGNDEVRPELPGTAVHRDLYLAFAHVKGNGNVRGGATVALPGQSGLDAGPHLSLEDHGVCRQRQDVDGAGPHHVNQLDPAAGSTREIDSDLSRSLAARREVCGAYDFHGCLHTSATNVPARRPLEVPDGPRIFCARSTPTGLAATDLRGGPKRPARTTSPAGAESIAARAGGTPTAPDTPSSARPTCRR